MPNYAERIRRAQQRMRDLKLSALLISAPSDLLYLIGYHFHPSERMTVLAIQPEGQPAIVMPQFETAKLGPEHHFLAVHAWTESENPYLDRREYLFGALKPGEKKTWSVTVKVPKDITSRRDGVTVKFQSLISAMNRGSPGSDRYVTTRRRGTGRAPASTQSCSSIPGGCMNRR